MKICGIIIAKENSNRFPGKNYHEVNGKPMFMRGVDLIANFTDRCNIYVYTNSKFIHSYNCGYLVKERHRITVTPDSIGYWEAELIEDESMAGTQECKFIIMDRSINACHDEQPYLDILRVAYMQLPKQYDIIISILANSIGHSLHALKCMIEIVENNDKIMEVRSFNRDGEQSGMFVFREKYILDFYMPRLIDMGAVFDSGREIHYEEEL